MSRSRLFFYLLLPFLLQNFLWGQVSDKNEAIALKNGIPKEKDRSYIQIVFKNGVHDYNVGSYYDALDEFTYVSKFPNSPYFLDSLYYLAKTYLAIGKRTGEKKFFWGALNYINLYLSRGGKESADYYFLKGLIFENLGFYERSIAIYEMGLKKAQSQRERVKLLIGLLRAAALANRKDMFLKYRILISMETLTKEQRKELEFIKGLYYFYQGEYNKAFEYLLKTYRKFEDYLIDNPEFYYIVAEDAYRKQDLRLARQLFKRILKYVKNRDVLQKTLLRLGDIAFLQNNLHQSVGYYYRLIKRFPKGEYALIAKLKIIYMMKKDKKIAYYLKKFLPDAHFLQDPDNFVLQTLIKNRGNYIGLFALANFGMEVLSLNSPKLYKRLIWELSMVPIKYVKYEHIEYFQRLWKPLLLKLDDPQKICALYKANPRFFIKVFDLPTLLHLAKNLYRCDTSKKEYIDILKKIYKKYPQDNVLYLLVEVFYELKKYNKALEYLHMVSKKDCYFYIYESKLCFLLKKQCSTSIDMVQKSCKTSNFYKNLFQSYMKLANGELDTSFVKNNESYFVKNYRKDPVVRRYVEILAKKLIEKEQYKKIIDLLSPIASYIKEDCFLNGVLSLSYVRIGKMKYAAKLLQEGKGCSSFWYEIAKAAYEDIELAKEAKGE